MDEETEPRENVAHPWLEATPLKLSHPASHVLLAVLWVQVSDGPRGQEGVKKGSSGTSLHWAPQTDLAGTEGNAERHESAGAFYYLEGTGTEFEGSVKGQEGLCGSIITYTILELCVLNCPSISWPMERRRALCCPHIVSPWVWPLLL